jgi:tRNA(Ile)-lysidine synthase
VVRIVRDLRDQCAAQASAGDRGVLVACSGGADSLALADAVAFVAPRSGVRAGLVTVDHQLQDGSAERAERVAGWARATGFSPVVISRIDVRGYPGGPEAAARTARYEALVAVAREHRVPTVLLGHTREDQAETVLLALLRGAGPAGMSGMPVRRYIDGPLAQRIGSEADPAAGDPVERTGPVALVRPILAVTRAQTRAACAAAGLQPWEDPHNTDPAYTRTRARALLDVLSAELGPAVVANLARTAQLLAADGQVLDALVDDAFLRLREASGVQGEVSAADWSEVSIRVLTELPDAVRTRLLHRWARQIGAGGAALASTHIAAMDALVTRWHGQGSVYLPGGVTVSRAGGVLVARPGVPARTVNSLTAGVVGNARRADHGQTASHGAPSHTE